jgi:hypothetical protein
LNNSKEVVSVGIHWLNEEQAQHFAKMMETASTDEGNVRRGASISAVRSGLDCNYEPMKEIFAEIISSSR